MKKITAKQYKNILLGKKTSETPDPALTSRLMRAGLLLHLFQSADKESILILKDTIVQSPFPDCKETALSLLSKLSFLGEKRAKEAILDLTIHDQHEPAAALAIENKWLPEAAGEKARFLFLTHQLPAYFAFDPDQAHLTQIYQKSEPHIQQRLLNTAKTRSMQHWLILIALIHAETADDIDAFIQAAADFKPGFRQTAFQTIVTLAAEEHPIAQAALCRWYIAFDDQKALEIILEKGYQPIKPEQTALFYLLSGQWEAYDAFDFKRTYLALCYELAERPLRRRIITQARKLGRIEWEHVFGAGRKIRFAEDMHDEEWQLAIRVLRESKRWDELWRLANIAPPLWSAEALISLADADWDRPAEAEGVENLIALARQAAQTAPKLFLLKTIEAHPEGITALAAHPDKPLIFSAGRDQTVRIWNANKKTHYEKLILKNGLAMVIHYDPENGLLTTGNSDNLIYIYRLHDQHLVKTFVGHSAPIKSLAFSSDGHMMASGSFDNTTRLWRYPSGPELKTVKAHKGEIFTLVASPMNAMLVSAGADKSIQTYQFADLAPKKRIKAHQDTILALAAGSHSQILASASRDHSIQLWQLPSLERKGEILTTESVITHLLFLLEDQLLIGTDMEGHFGAWQIHQQKKILSRQDHTGAITGLQVLDQGRLLATAGMDGKLQIYLLSAFILVRRPLLQINMEQINYISNRLTTTHTTSNQHTWIAFTEQMVKWRARFDIQLENTAPINLGEFDIEL